MNNLLTSLALFAIATKALTLDQDDALSLTQTTANTMTPHEQAAMLNALAQGQNMEEESTCESQLETCEI